MAEKKKLIDEALIDIASIQAVLKANTKEILRATMHEEINAVVKESLLKEIGEEDWSEEDVETPELGGAEGGMETPELGGAEGGMETPELPIDADPMGGNEFGGDEFGGEDELGGGMPGGEMDTLDLTSASDDEVISVFKKLSGEDEIEIVSNKEVKIKDPQSGNEYIVTLGGEQPSENSAPMGGLDAATDAEPDGDSDDEFELSIGGDEEGEESGEEGGEEIGGDEEEIGGDDEESEESGEESGDEETEDDDEIKESSGIVYEIELQEMEDISKRPDKLMGKEHPKKGYELAKGKGKLATGDIEGQTAEMSDQFTPKGKKDHSPAEGIGSGKLATGKIEGQKAKTVDRADTNTQGGFKEATPGKKGNHAEHVMETEEEVTEEVEAIEEKISVGTKEKEGRKSYAGLTNIKGPGAKNESYDAVKNEVVKRYNALVTEVKALRNEREEFKANLGKFRDMLAEAVVYNSNLTYVTKLFMEHSTTKAEKETIMKRFDSEVTSLKESKKLYKTLVSELSSKKVMNESVIDKTNKTQTSSASQLNESTAYVDNSTKRIIDLIKRVETR